MSENVLMSDILVAVADERDRQERLKADGKFKTTCADRMRDVERLAVLAEEFGEVAHEVSDSLNGVRVCSTDLRDELIQVAAVAVAWVEAIDRGL